MTFTATELDRAVDAATFALKKDLREAQKEIGQLTDQINMLRYAFKGLCGEQLHLRVEITGTSLLHEGDVYTYLDFVARRGAKHLAYEALARFEDTHKLHQELAHYKAAAPASAFLQSEFERGY